MKLQHDVKQLVDGIGLVIFDIDQTLVDSLERNRDAAQRFLSLYGLPHDDDFFAAAATKTAADVAPDLSRRVRRPISEAEVMKNYVDSYLASPVPIRVMDGAASLIDRLKSMGKVVTAMTAAGKRIHDINMVALQEVYAASGGRGMMFDATHYYHDGHTRKDAEAFDCLLQHRLQQRIYESLPEDFRTRTLVIGDSSTDMVLAAMIGAQFIRVRPTYTVLDVYRQLTA